MAEVEWVRYGRLAAEALRVAIAAAKADDPLFPVTVVVPSNSVGVAVRRLLASGDLGPTAGRGQGIGGVAFLTVYRLAELLGAAELASQERRPVSTPVIGAALRATLAADPGIFAPCAEHPATEEALVAAYRELRDVSPAALDRLASQSRRAGDVVRLHRAARGRLVPAFSDEEDLVAAALGVLATDDAASRILGTVVVYLPERLSRHGGALLAAVAERAPLRVLAGTTADERADAEVLRSVRRIWPDAAPPTAPSTPAGRPELTGVVSTGRTRIVTLSDADDEVRHAVRAVVDAARSGTPLERIALLYAGSQPYARLVHEQLTGAGIAHNGASATPLTARVAARALLGYLSLPETGYRRAEVFAWLSASPIRNGNGVVPVTAWERLSRDAGVVAGRAQWDRLLAAYARECDTETANAEADPDAPSWRTERWHRDAERCRALRDFVLSLVDDLTAAAQPRSWPEHAGWARRRLAELLGPERRRLRWPLVEQKAAERIERALDRLACLGTVEGAVGLEVFARTLRLELEADLGRVGRMGEGVVVGTVGMGAGLDLDLVVVLGLAEGSFPAAVGEDSLLPDDERRAAGGELTLRADTTDRQHHQLLTALAGARSQLLAVPRGDLRRSNERVPSRWVVQIAEELAGRPIGDDGIGGLSAPWLEHVASFDAGLRRTAFPATAQEHHLRSLLAVRTPATGTGTPRRDVLGDPEADPVLRAGEGLVQGRAGTRFTRYDGNLGGLELPSPAQEITSATRLEGWAACPYAYFVRQILRVEPVENPEDRLVISPQDLGSLIHEVLERFVTEVLDRPASEQPNPREPWSEADHRRLREIAGDVCDRYEQGGMVGRALFWQRDRRRMMADLAAFLAADDQHRAAHDTRPVAAELAFGLPGTGLGSVGLPLPGGREVRFRGKADRLDVTGDGKLEVVDYKTGRADRFKELNEANPDARGTKLQLVVYALAARLHQGRPDAPVVSEYWFTSSKGRFERIGYPVTAQVLERVGATVGKMVTGIENGVFPPYPRATSTSPGIDCAYCDPDGLGVADVRRQVERKRDDPALATFFDLAEGEILSADDAGTTGGGADG